ncbi:hypothetical protein CC86DRAFT_288709 [Ophiobolus disseminans]|uniref:Uncharacterized protein n=1 Tax=Ophiobolus disseminans TaxID=1469910 RepID=A0A6A7A782_9PLEO|nr:hypothetical protein CC86DRAFT_288709 [Ophiobolus disseminans]
MIYTDRLRLCKLILQVALSDQGKASRAVYHAILAISSYHQGGDLLYVDQLKRTALNELRTDVVSSEREGVQHIAANLLLCVLEMQQTSGNNSGWVGYISGVKQVIDAVKEAEPPVGSDASLVLGWVYYFEVMARFVFRHWRTEYVKAVAKALGFDANGSDSCRLQYILARASFTRSIPNISMHAHPIMVLLAEIAETAMYSSDPRYTTPEYQRYLNDLRSRLEQVSPLTHTVDGSMHNEVDHHTTLLLDLTRLAGLIYLERVSRNFSGQSARIDSWTRQALSTLTELDSCLCPFALSIVGCETVRDADRLIILGLYSRMEARPHLQSFMDIKSLLHTAWNLQDLAEEGELEYIQKLNIVFSSRDVVPSLI